MRPYVRGAFQHLLSFRQVRLGTRPVAALPSGATFSLWVGNFPALRRWAFLLCGLKSKGPPSGEALEGSFSYCLNYSALVFRAAAAMSCIGGPPPARRRLPEPRAHGASKHDELAAAGLSPGEIRGADHNNMRGTHFYCTAPGNVLVEIAKPPKR